jgi:hypothetical protein
MIKRNTLGLSIAAMFAMDREAFSPASSCSIDLFPSSVQELRGAAAGVQGGLRIRNGSVAQQAFTAATIAYFTGSALAIPQGAYLRAGSRFHWKWNMHKTAAGVATSTIAIVFGTLGTAAGDTARVSFTKPAGTGVEDEAWCEIHATVRNLSDSAGVVVGTFTMGHNLAATGHAQIPFVAITTISAGFDNKVDGLIVGLVMTTGAADVVTVEQMQAEAEL